MTTEERRKPGRPAGSSRVGEAHLYLTQQDRRLLEALKAATGLGTSAVFRLALRELARKERVE